MKDKLLFDIGYNIGLYSKEMTEAIPNLTIVGVEANPSLMNKCWTHPKVTILNKALSDVDGDTIEFYVNNAAPSISTANKDWTNKSRFAQNYRWDQKIKVETITLDSMIEMYGEPDHIKIDVEGYEHIAIKGLTQKQKGISFEWHEEFFDPHTIETVNYLKSLGYEKFNYTTSNNFNDIPEKYFKWEELKMESIITPGNKTKMGMIFCK